jgi:hypothetical protein
LFSVSSPLATVLQKSPVIQNNFSPLVGMTLLLFLHSLFESTSLLQLDY